METKSKFSIETAKEIPEIFPVIKDDKISDSEDVRYDKDGIVTEYSLKTKVPAGYNFKPKELKLFVLSYPLGDLHYIFTLFEHYRSGMFDLSFKTKEYDYGSVDLNAEEKEKLIKIINSFLLSVEPLLGENQKEINFTPAEANYTAKEFDDCLEKILTSPDIKMTKEQILAEYKGYNIFDLYRQVFGEEYEIPHDEGERAHARNRLFRMSVKKYFPKWEFVENEYGGKLKRKKE